MRERRDRVLFQRILIAGWVVIGIAVAALVAFPRAVARIPHLALLRPFLIILGLCSIAYVIVGFYRGGMSRARRG